MNELVTVIVPVYNCIRYLEECVNSILSQTYQNLEILLVDDGSSDGSIEKCYSFHDNRIKVFTGSNHGVSHARNIGLENANGDYIVFVDSDDCCESNLIDILVRMACGSDCAIVKSFSDSGKADCSNSDIIFFNSKNAIEELHKGVLFQGQVWGKIFRKELVSDLLFREELAINEDMCFVQSYFLRCKRISFSDRTLYFYRVNENSALNSSFRSKDLSARDAALIMRNEGMNVFPDLSAYYNKTLIVSDMYIMNKLLKNQHMNFSLLKIIRSDLLAVSDEESLAIYFMYTNAKRASYERLLHYYYLEIFRRRVKIILRNGKK